MPLPDPLFDPRSPVSPRQCEASLDVRGVWAEASSLGRYYASVTGSVTARYTGLADSRHVTSKRSMNVSQRPDALYWP